jgi:hypothetical protein
MPRILRDIRIDEVSAVTKSAGVGTRVVIMKRADDADDVYASEWYREQVAEAERQNEAHLRSARTPRSFNEVLAEHTAKSLARGDEAEGLIADPPPVDDAIADAADRDDGIVFDVGDTRLEFPNERALAVWLAVQERIRKSNQEESTAMTKTTEELEAERAEKLRAVVKAHGITAVAKQIIAGESSYGIDEHEFTRLATEHAQRVFPGDRPDVAFAKLFADNSELRRAHSIVKSAGAAPYFDLQPVFVGGDDALDVDDPSEAIAQLKEIGRQKWPSLSEAQAFERAFTDPANAELAAKAHRRPAATTVYPFPK